MDLNHLLSSEQIALIRADAAGCVPSRDAHLGMAREYRRRIHRAFPLSNSALRAAA